MRIVKLGPKFLHILDALNWKEIKGFGKTYYTSPDGEIYSITLSGKLKPLKPWETNHYLYVKLKCEDGKYRGRRVNRLVTAAYYPNPDNKPFSHHKNHNTLDNRYVNLGWATASENALWRRPKNELT